MAMVVLGTPIVLSMRVVTLVAGSRTAANSYMAHLPACAGIHVLSHAHLHPEFQICLWLKHGCPN